ncbi:sulfurtransferase complex subunit TusD [Pseudoalteromonas pernae]|uniref:sulfurtransferase complex subunit TusD n=1 Tax=Pseudoalteromonas pernae TaxID=3118054 RepID=UPI0032423146
MASFVLSLHTAASDTCTLQALQRFAHSAIANGHELKCIFLYQDGVYHALSGFDIASDEFNPADIWQSLFELNIPVHVCVTAASKRGVSVCDNSQFLVSGLAEFAMEVAQADRWVQFK